MSEKIDNDITSLLNKNFGKKKRINSIRKGKKFERDLAKILTDLLGIEICRVPMSGGFATMHNSDTLAGDLMAVHKTDFMPFTIESKHFKDLNILDILNEKLKQNTIFEWIRQSEEEGKQMKKVPFILFKLNNSQIYAISQNFNFNNPVSSNPSSREFLVNKNLVMMFNHKDKWYIITPFTNFKIRELYDELKKLRKTND
jgi:Holliday junction resolvase